MADLAQEQRLDTPQTAQEFSFPLTAAYGIQVEFMQRLFETLERGEMGIFESPTGTGKSLSIICGALTWLARHRARAPAELSDDDATRPEWVRAYERKQRQLQADPAAEARARYERWESRVRRRELGEARARRQAGRQMGRVTTAAGRKRQADKADGASDDEHMVVAEYDSGGEQAPYAESVRRLLAARDRGRIAYDSDDSDCGDSEESGEPEEPSLPKVFYASRTHSQLQQFVGEIKRTAFAHTMRCVTLGSRVQLCTNDQVRGSARASAQQLTERCLELQQGKQRCAQLPARRTPMLDFRDALRVADIEDLAGAGRTRGVCAYYGARAAVASAHVVALPYNMLLSQSARAAMGISLRGSVVVVDEAHNLVDTILGVHSAVLDARTVDVLLDLVQRYFSRYWQRMRGSNVVYVRMTLALLRALRKYMQAAAAGTRVKRVGEFLQDARADHINVFKVDRYLRESRIGRKLNMFAERAGDAAKRTDHAAKRTDHAAKRADHATEPAAHAAEPAVAPATAVAALEAFIECVGRPDRTGARIVERQGTHGTELAYVLLDASDAFAALRLEARAVVLAGGTMAPTADVVAQLLPRPRSALCAAAERDDARLDPARVRVFAWGHVIHASHMRALVLGSGPTGTALRLTHAEQRDAARMRECGLALAALCNVVPGGVVVFFPSYALLAAMLREWRACGVAERIGRRKPLVAEAPGCGDVLAEYVAAVGREGGAVLLSVVGGRLSEGINFSDDLGRAVVMVGVPFPSLASPELCERLAYYESLGSVPDSDEPGFGCKPEPLGVGSAIGPRAREMYEALCMRAVNQSIGRAIRHQRDYAVVVFMDARYAEPRIARKLPRWITDGRPLEPLQFGPALAQVAAFFKQDFSV
ncbi:ATP-dependent DNA helicase chl1 [Coemansia sp. RSA 2711]|nr:ATP-dependent DNA helicase chl1 [Coemansia sp. RSA 2711]